jgi:hypothetical protein
VQEGTPVQHSPEAGTGQYSAADVQTGPTISPRTNTVPFSVPGAQVAHDAVQKLIDWSNMTQEGKQQHPVQAAVGQAAARIKQMLVGGEGGGLDMKTGFVTNPVIQAISAAPGDEEINLARNVVTKGKNLVTAPFKAAAASEAGRAVTQTLAPETAIASISATRNAATSGGAATTAITNGDVLQHAADEGIKLTPAQALGTSAAKSEQTLGEEALLTGSKVKEAIAENKSKLSDAVDAFQDKLDPQRVGMTAEAAGEHLQNSAEIAKSALKDNVNYAYDQVKSAQANLAGDVQTPLRQFYEDTTHARQSGAAVTQPVFKTAAERTALNDINEMLQDPALQGRASIESLRNLRSNLIEKGSNYGANALSDSGQRIYKLAAGKVDDAIMAGAKGTDFEPLFREASASNVKLQELYNTKGSALYRILNTDDPAAVTDGILNRGSVHEIEQLKSEGVDTGPLARQAVEDIKNGGFRVTQSGLGGYPDTFLRSLLGPDATKELYMKADIARRLAENYNPSGSGKVVLGASQVFHPVAAVAAQAARARSMPQPALNFLERAASGAAALTGKP